MVALVLSATHLLPAQPALNHPSSTQPPIYGQTLDGTAVHSLAGTNARAVVLFFIASDCPISNRTLPEMLRVRDEFTTSGASKAPGASRKSGVSAMPEVRVWFVYPNSTETPAGIRTHWSAFGSGPPNTQLLLDPTGVLTRLARARATPEAVVLTPDATGWRPVYAGRIDDRYVRLGLERPRTTQQIAERVVREVLSGQPIEHPTGALVGCGIINPGAHPGADPGADAGANSGADPGADPGTNSGAAPQ